MAKKDVQKTVTENNFKTENQGDLELNISSVFNGSEVHQMVKLQDTSHSKEDLDILGLSEPRKNKP